MDPTEPKINKQMEKLLREERKREREGRLTNRVRGMDRWGERGETDRQGERDG